MKRLFIPVVTLVVLAAVMILQSVSKQTRLAEPPPVTAVDIPGFAVTNLPPSESELTVLPKDTVIRKFRYESAAQGAFLVTIVIGGESKSSIHRPELCLPSQGFLMTEPRSVEQAGIPWRCYTLASNAGNSGNLGFAYTFVNQEGVHTASHVRRIIRDVWDRSIYARIDRWAMITVVMGARDESSRLDFLNRLGRGIKW